MSLKTIIISLLIFILPTFAIAFEWVSPTTRFMEKETWAKVDEGLRQNHLSTEYKNFFDQIAKEEDKKKFKFNKQLFKEQ